MVHFWCFVENEIKPFWYFIGLTTKVKEENLHSNQFMLFFYLSVFFKNIFSYMLSVSLASRFSSFVRKFLVFFLCFPLSYELHLLFYGFLFGPVPDLMRLARLLPLTHMLVYASTRSRTFSSFIFLREDFFQIASECNLLLKICNLCFPQTVVSFF